MVNRGPLAPSRPLSSSKRHHARLPAAEPPCGCCQSSLPPFPPPIKFLPLQPGVNLHIQELQIRNYRNFRNAKLRFNKGINTIVGENASGKSNIFSALRILLDDSMPRNLRLKETDFNRGLPHWAGHWIILSVVFGELDPSEEAQSIAIHSTGHMATSKTGSYSFFFRPKHHIRNSLFDLAQHRDKNPNMLDEILNKISIEDYESTFLCRGEADFSDNSVYTRLVGNFDDIQFPDPNNKSELEFGTWLPKEINIHNEVSCTFIKALRDVESDLKSYNGNPLLNMLRGKGRTVETSERESIIGSIDKLNEKIGALSEVKEVKLGIDKSIRDAVGTTYSPNIDIKSELPNDMEKLFQSLKLWVGDPNSEGYMGRIWELSLGGANLIYLSLKLLEYEKTKTDKIANFLLIEEPEAHIHTHIQKTFFENISKGKTQVIISTHSTHISSASKIRSINIVHRVGQDSSVFHPSNGLSPVEASRIERYLDAVRSDLLFAKSVLLIEGDAEQILIPEIFRRMFGISLDEIGVSLINIGSTEFETVSKLFHPERIRKKCAIITDSDKSIIPLPDDAGKDTPEETNHRASEESGKLRLKKLAKLCEGNKYLKVFPANNTFEVDLVVNGNSYVYIQSLDAIYKKAVNIAKSTERLKTESVDIAGTEVLRLAEKHGKGWLALIVAENARYNTNIPTYILKAIAFSCDSLNKSSTIKMIAHRIKCISRNTKDTNNSQAVAFTFSPDEDGTISSFLSQFPDDQLSEFYSYMMVL